MSVKPQSPGWRADQYKKHGGFVADLATPLVALIQLEPTARVLDLGCGDGVLTEQLAATGATVVGVDSASDLLVAAKARGLDVRFMDAEQLTFESEFDTVFSNAALHWMRNIDAVIRGVWRALKPGGRFVGEFGGRGNVNTVTTVLSQVMSYRVPSGSFTLPWYFPSTEEWRAKLETGGFVVDTADLFPRPTKLPTDLGGWLDTFAHSLLAQLPPEERDSVCEEVIGHLEPILRDAQGTWVLDYVRLQFSARAVKI